ncbi:MAG: dihydrolipoyl dehydrogenase [Actinomycetota bacterium]|nr:dihydrolipoyl dehydrogenase [Actinomycetota bacterium]
MHDVAIIGGGPGGYAAALYAHNFGLSVALVEKDRVGGTCLVRGCIPAKTWLQTASVYQTVARSAEFGVGSSGPILDWSAALTRKNQIVDGLVKGLSGLLKTRGIEIHNGFGRIVDGGVEVTAPDGVTTMVPAAATIVATGSVPRTIPGYEIDGEQIVTSDHALDWDHQPDRVAVIGAGAIGAEFASMLADVGSEVHLFEALDQILPGMEPEAAKAVGRSFRKKRIKVKTGIQVGPPRLSATGVAVPVGDDSVEVDVVLVAVGRAPVTEGIGLETAGIDTDRGFIPVDLETMQTAVPNIYAVGDVVAGTPQLAHVGFAEAIAAITHIATGETAPVNYRAVPMIVYTHPEAAAVGLTEAQAIEQGFDVEVTNHGMRGVGRAIIHGETGGTVKIVAQKDGPILGATVVDPIAGEIIHELMYAVGWEALPSEAAMFIHGHPTISEGIGETMLVAAGRPLH